MRTFLAFNPPEDTVRRIERLQHRLQAEGLAVRWVEPANIHLTLKFLGETDPAAGEGIERAMQAAVAGQAPLEMALGGLGGFPRLSRPRVLWQAVAGEVDRLEVIQQALDVRLTRCGFEREKRPFRAHLTIGRIRRPQRWRTADAAIARRMQDLPLVPFTVDTLIWYESRLCPGGAQYTALARAPLRAASTLA
ncbi:MAG: RNA 2',3'-cyclic phosphodiesterase [Desulfobacterales bacterium]|nr:RNA 2',3'-cyclic phosphodiesterase [Desulfobacterales bacterium]MDJ0853975.1 RNA 2',3'-cyclic phosphodiesterase [Desulfobacterales bacterium]MDJ0991912.1 RNA 2',3'-cyclic phosphodiesterase [Desulfobacterales bacterium]